MAGGAFLLFISLKCLYNFLIRYTNTYALLELVGVNDIIVTMMEHWKVHAAPVINCHSKK